MNKENYRNAVNQIKAKKELKEKTFEKIKQKKKSKVVYIKYLAACAVLVLVFSYGIIYYKRNQPNSVDTLNTTEIASIENELPRFKNMEQLRKALNKNNNIKENIQTKGIVTDTMTSSLKSSNTAKVEDYSTTNVQVQNVDEADIVKTDGKYIYYISNEKIYIIDANDLTILSNIKVEEKNEKFYPKELYINRDRLIILGNSSEYTEEYKNEVTECTARISSNYMAKALVYDISDIESVKQIRKIGLDGNYIQSRMVGENIYFISSKSPTYNAKMEDNDILPMIQDTCIAGETKKIDCTNIAYFEGTEYNNYMIIAGFNINNNNEVTTETFFGANDTIYASEENLYITQSIYKNGYFSKGIENIIYKFNMEDSKIQLKCKGKIKGYLNNQFSMDEYEGNLRIATTSNDEEESTNQLYILDENLNMIGKIKNLAKGEKIYSVRFIGKVGYIVTFKQIDPLFVIDLSNPTKPVVKGELKIPGYSSYLHPYDETHIIGIGYNTKSNGYGGITNSSMKMSMFDVSDLENPKEMFNTNIGEDYAYSEIVNNHKALFYNKDKDLIGFPVNYREKNAKSNNSSFIIFKIDLENGFEKYGEIKQNVNYNNYKTNIERAIYIGDKFYTLSNTKIVLYDLNTIEEIKELKLEYD